MSWNPGTSDQQQTLGYFRSSARNACFFSRTKIKYSIRCWREETVPRRAKITALSCYTPPRILSNADLEKMVDTSDAWIRERTGIVERHIVDKGVATSDLAYEASKSLLEKRGLSPTEIEAIVVATVTPDTFFPSTACLLQHRLGAVGAWGFDL